MAMKLVDATQLDSDLGAIASAIRTKGGATGGIAYSPGHVEAFVNAVNAISGGGDSDALDEYLEETITSYSGNAASIKNGAFYWAENLTSVSAPVCTVLGDQSFEMCESLTSVSIPSVIEIGKRAFRSCSLLESVSLDSCESIGEQAFYDCTNLAEIHIGTTNCVLATSNCFTGTKIANGEGYIYVPESALEHYKTANNWILLANQIVAEP